MILKSSEWNAVMNQTCHLILKHEYYDAIDRGDKTIEYRDNTEYYRKRILKAKFVTFHRGYTRTTMTFKIHHVTSNGQLEIHLGERLKKHVHKFWREDLGECHNPTYGCWCCRCSGFMCKCLCHREEG